MGSRWGFRVGGNFGASYRTMGLQIARGREAKPPLRPLRSKQDVRPRLQQATGQSTAAAPAKKSLPRFPVSPDAKAFYRRFYPGTSTIEWNDWRWQMRARIRTLDELARIFHLSDDEYRAVKEHTGSLPVGITPYYASLMDLKDPHEPLRRTHIMIGEEYLRGPGEDDDPLAEDHDTAVPGIGHRYPERALFRTTGTGPTCRPSCTRAGAVGKPGGACQFPLRQCRQALAYLADHPEVRGLLMSGGDPVTLGDDKLDWLLARLRAIKQIQFVRIGT